MNDSSFSRLRRQSIPESTVASNEGWPGQQFGYYGAGEFQPDPASRDHGDARKFQWVLRLVDVAAIVMMALVVTNLEARTLPHQHAVWLSVANLVSVLVYCLCSRHPTLSERSLPELILQQFVLVTPSLLPAVIVQAGIFSWLGANGQDVWRESIVWTVVSMAGLVASRSGGNLLLRRDSVQQRNRRKVAIIGYGDYAARVADRLNNGPRTGVSVAGIFHDGAARGVNQTIDDLINISRQTQIHGIVIAYPPGAGHEDEILNLTLRLRCIFCDVLVMPHLVHGPDVALPIQSFGAMSFMVLRRCPLDEAQLFAKRALDLAVSLVACVTFFLPLFVIVAAAIKLESRGPVLFRQPRRGFNNVNFTVFKFRTMYTCQTDLFSDRQTSRGDPRVTRVGRWLRRLSIDELPQILNVLRGEMSLVGPRPHALNTRVEGELLSDAIGDYLMRYQVKPGITGWAQINGSRGELLTREDLRRRLAYDLAYIQYWSIWFDLKIMAITAAREIVSKHAF
jgi:Undecaprenyl-phosphate glucose phosphotransferase